MNVHSMLAVVFLFACNAGPVATATDTDTTTGTCDTSSYDGPYACPPCVHPLSDLCAAWVGGCPAQVDLLGTFDDPILEGEGDYYNDWGCDEVGCVTVCGTTFEIASYYFDSSGALQGAAYVRDHAAYCEGTSSEQCFGQCEDTCGS